MPCTAPKLPEPTQVADSSPSWLPPILEFVESSGPVRQGEALALLAGWGGKPVQPKPEKTCLHTSLHSPPQAFAYADPSVWDTLPHSDGASWVFDAIPRVISFTKTPWVLRLVWVII